MRRSIVLVALAACGPHPTPHPEIHVTSPSTPPASPPQPPTNPCQHALVALADGRLDAWPGADGCTRADADRVFGATGKPDEPGLFGKAQDYPARPGAPHGLEIDYSDRGDVVAILVNYPRLAVPLEQEPGPPASVLPSRLGGDVEQRVWPARGLAAHVQQHADVVTLVAFRKMTLEEYQGGSWSAALQTHEEPMVRP